MAIYTKTGDGGETSLFGGARIPKSAPRIRAYGTIDELSSVLGMIETGALSISDKQTIREIQKDLYWIMSILAGASDSLEKKVHTGLLSGVSSMERRIDVLEKKLPPLTHFILPGGSPLSAWFHIARTVCRRAERELVEAYPETPPQPQVRVCIQYVNRLSDLLFVFARWYNKNTETQL